MMSYSRALIGHAGQRGAALFMALIILLVLTLLGVVGMNVSNLENLMASNNQFQTSALNDSEYVLARGVEDILGIADADQPYPFNNYYYDISDTSVQPEKYVWTGFNTQGVTLPDGGTGKYVIVYAGLFNADGEPVDYVGATAPLPGGSVDAFIVSAQSESSKGAKRTVQSVVATNPLPK